MLENYLLMKVNKVGVIMSQLRDIKNRIDSVKKTRKMTQAMKMVAAAKFKRFSEEHYLLELFWRFRFSYFSCN